MASSSESTTAPPLQLIFTSLLRADFLVFMKHRRALIISTLLPLFLLVSTSSNKATDNFGGAVYIIGLAIAYGLMATSLMGYALTVARDREKGVFQRLRVTPAPTWTIMSSRLAMQSIANLIIALVVVIIGTRIHHISPSAGQYALVLVVSIVAGAVFLSIGQALVGLVKSADTLQAVARVLFAALIILGTLGQSGALGGFWESVSTWSPVGVVMTLFAGILKLSAWDSHDTLSLVACAGYIIVFSGIGIRWFQWDPR
ncbi:MAG: ABC transporter permease [Solirubrobacteraceae bacterium]